MLPAIRVENLGKSYSVNHAEERLPYKTLRDSLTRLATAPARRWRAGGHDGVVETFWALRDVNFDVQPGEVVGIIGRNGAGKSTLLKILSRITMPTTGRATIRGRVGSLLEVGTGFHPELTGRENIYMNGSILGMSRAEIKNKFDEIVDFSGVEKFLDTPIKRYSSGMQVRLAFAVAANLDPEILIIDEVLAVGDAEFQKKCLGKMQDVAACGRTVLFVSHNMPAVRSLTSTCVYLENGRVVEIGSTEDVIDSYLSRSLSVALDSERESLDYFRRNKNAAAPVHFHRIRVNSSQTPNGNLAVIASGEPIELSFDIDSTINASEACISLSLLRNQEQCAVTLYSPDAGFRLPVQLGRNSFQCRIEGLPLTAGKYSINCGINKNASTIAYDVILDLPLFDVKMPDVEDGTLDWPHRPWGAIHWEQVRWRLK